MALEAFHYYARTQKWQCMENTACGLFRGWPFRADVVPGPNNLIYISFRVDGALAAGHLRTLNRALPKDCTASQPWSGAVELACGGRDADLDGRLRRSLEATAATLSAAGHHLPRSCPCCGEQDCDSLALWGGGFVPVHRRCVEAGVDMGCEAPAAWRQGLRWLSQGPSWGQDRFSPSSLIPYTPEPVSAEPVPCARRAQADR